MAVLWPWAVASLLALLLYFSGVGAFLGSAMNDMSAEYNNQYSMDDGKEEEEDAQPNAKKDK